MRSPVINVEDVLSNPAYCDENSERGKFQARFGLIGRALGTQNIGLNIAIIPPGKAAHPRHYHYINDEMFVVLAGTGTLHYGDVDYPLKALDVIHIEAGSGIPFQIANTGSDELRYLALSTLNPADVFVYPDSNKVGFMAKAAPFRELSEDGLPGYRKWISADMEVDYWEGEPDAET